jgi:hydroxymethylpyrimidine/phosphomethylpyrimidine kinase
MNFSPFFTQPTQPTQSLVLSSRPPSRAAGAVSAADEALLAEEDFFETPGLVMCFNAADPTGASGLSADQAAIAAMGAHTLPVTTAILVRDSTEVLERIMIDDEAVIDQARAVLEDSPAQVFKIGNLDNVETVSAVAELLSDYPDNPVVLYVSNLPYLEQPQFEDYLSAINELLVPQADCIVGSKAVLERLLLPDWEAEAAPTPWQIAQAAGEAGCGHVLMTSVTEAQSRGSEVMIENLLLTPETTVLRERFERLPVSFNGAGDTLSAALAGLLATEMELAEAVVEALAYLDQALEAGFRPGMGNLIPDRFFWASAEDEEGEEIDLIPPGGSSRLQ